ncbi:GlyGly-CTERM sorting domain-containing protein [Niallia circulans]|nr:GlyGly-CTERM sorting domain-containing protein [Niallia circulans]
MNWYSLFVLFLLFFRQKTTFLFLILSSKTSLLHY